MKKIALLGLGALVLSGCTTLTANHPVDHGELKTIRNICIEDNPKVIVPNFKEILASSFSRHAITTRVTGQGDSENCEYLLKYNALRSWDFVTYMTDADLDLQKNGKTISFANFHLKGGGGLAFTKWRSTESKVDMLVNELLGKPKQIQGNE